MRRPLRKVQYLSWFLIAMSVYAQQQAIQLGQSAVALTGPWRFNPGDSPVVNGQMQWAKPDFDDSQWGTTDLTPTMHSVDLQFENSSFLPGWTVRGCLNLHALWVLNMQFGPGERQVGAVRRMAEF